MAKGKGLAQRDIVTLAAQALVMRREGQTSADIALRLGVTEVEAVELARMAYAQIAPQTADHLRTEVEDRLDTIVRKANVDLGLAQSQGERTALYRVLLAAEAQRARLLGLDLPKGLPDAGPADA